MMEMVYTYLWICIITDLCNIQECQIQKIYLLQQQMVAVKLYDTHYVCGDPPCTLHIHLI